jgi:SAM-dependent methyltransferase
VVDLGSGTGEHARWLAEQGFAVVGIEGVKERWEVARGIDHPNVEHLLGDFGAVEAMVRGHFGAAICLGNTLPAVLGVEALSRTLIGLRRRLLPRGVFVAQVLNYDRLESQGATELPERRLERDGEELVFRTALAFEPEGVVGITETVVDRAGSLLFRRQRHQQAWRHDQLVTLLEVARFTTIEAFGGFAGEPFDSPESEELILVAV